MELKMQFNTSVPPGVLHYIFSGYKILRPWLMATRMKGPINDISVINNMFQEVLKTGFFVNPPPVEIYSRQLLKFISVLAGNKSTASIEHYGYSSTFLSNPVANTAVPTSFGKPVKTGNSSGNEVPFKSPGNHELNTASPTYLPQSSVNNQSSLLKQLPLENRIANNPPYPTNIASTENQKSHRPGPFSSLPSDPLDAKIHATASNRFSVPSIANSQSVPLWPNRPHRVTNESVPPSFEHSNVRPNEPPSQVYPASTLSSKSSSKPHQPSQEVSQNLPNGDSSTPKAVEPSTSQFNFQKVYPDVSPYLTPDNIGSAILYSTNDFSKSEPDKPRLNLSLELKLMENKLEKGELGPNMKGDLRNLADWDAISLVSSQFPSLSPSSFRPDGSFLKHRRFNDEIMENKEIMEKAIKQLNLSPSDAERLRERNRVQVLDDKKLCFSLSKSYPSNHNQLLDRFDKLPGNRKPGTSKKVATKVPTPSAEKLPETEQTQENEVGEDVPLLSLSNYRPNLLHNRKQNSNTKAARVKTHVESKKSSNDFALENIDLSSIKASKETSNVAVDSYLAKNIDVAHVKHNVNSILPGDTEHLIEVIEKPINEQRDQETEQTETYRKEFTQKPNKELPGREDPIRTEDSSKQVDEYNNQKSHSLISNKDDEVIKLTNSQIDVEAGDRLQSSNLTNSEAEKTRNSYVPQTIQITDSSDSENQFRDAVLSEVNVEQNSKSDGNIKKRSIESVDASSDPTLLTIGIPENQGLLNIKTLLNDDSAQQSSTSNSFNEEAGKSRETSDMLSIEKEPSLDSSFINKSQHIDIEKDTLQPVNTESSEVDLPTNDFQSLGHELLNASSDVNNSASDLSMQLKATNINQDVPLMETPILLEGIEADKQKVYTSLKSLPQGFTEFKCKWTSCEANLHSLENLFTHIKKLHTQCTDEGSTLKCCWNQCFLSLGSGQMDAHIREHLEKIQHNCKVPGCKKGLSNYEEFQEHLMFSHLPYKFEPSALITTRKSRLQEGNRRTRNNQGDKSAVPGFFLNTSTPIIKPAPSNWYPVPPPGFSPSVFARLNQNNQSKERTVSSLAKRNVFHSFAGLRNDHMKTTGSDSTSDAQYARVGQIGQLFTAVSKSECLPSMIIEGIVVQRKNWIVH
ncbi:SHREC complex intermodule linker subunit Clr1 [Schizosaccharomyces osmophilus]|uniref:SHREC complex intermodule linker subunit Clr1 n=1 Tax=Schizosaccharomyces osmophilus TaxID=2545709 RepID=A0AAE9WB62_9SCHI|nr:SHREC complex intermodule linker subunit Clr1 [Schizosaccharomyces osmophilus]WBW71393.1 SHREC complex intermodule linker subunit Clr1 [Schizosaccharomyces osmophilus]